MSIRVAINGFGRMGRLAFRAAWDCPDFNIVHINEINGGPEVAAHLLEFDSVHGHWSHQITSAADSLTVDGQKISFSNYPSPAETPWQELGIDIVIEASGRFRSVDTLDPLFQKRGKESYCCGAGKKRCTESGHGS